MSSDKDKRSSKLFGSRISSIFNVQPGYNVKHGNPDNHVSSTQRNAPMKPLSHPPLHNNSGRSMLDPHSLTASGHGAPQTHLPPSLQVPVKGPPRRKPPPPMMEEFEQRPSRNLAVDPPVNKISANKYGEEVKEDLNNIIGTLEKEIGSMLVINEPMTHTDADDHLHVDDQVSLTPGLNLSNTLDVSISNQSGPSYFSDSHSYNDSQKSITISKSNQSGPSFYSDTRSHDESQKSSTNSRSNHSVPFYSDTHSYNESQKSSISYNTDTQGKALDETSSGLTPSDTLEYNQVHEGGQIPYPIDSLPESPTFESHVAGIDLDSDYHHNISNGSKTSINSSIYSQGDGEPYSQLKSIETFCSSQSIPSLRKKEYQVGTSLSNTMASIPSARTPQSSSYVRSMQPNRNPMHPVPLESGTYDSNSRSKPLTRPSVSHHRKSSSVSSIWSANSYRSVNMSKLKKSLDLKPGEGERSNYVVTIRRSAGTAYNESPPGKWKLPIGILPIDSRIGYTSNGRYMRLARGAQGRNKKTSGVELKHGHLQPRLLAAEVDDGDEIPVLHPLGRSGTDLTIGTGKSSASGVRSSDSSINVTPNNSLLRKGSYGKTIDDLQSINTAGDSSSTLPSSKRAESVSSDSSPRSSSPNSLTDFNIGIGGYYQHPGYLHNDDDEETSTEFETDLMGEGGRNRNNDYNDYDTKPRLVLANPDNSDSD